MEQNKNITQNSHFKSWKYHTLVGNSYFERHQIMDSIEHYEIAICEAIMLIKMIHSGKAAVAALLASFHNLAELYTQQNEHALSENELTKAYNIINALLLNEQYEEQKEALRWGKSKANFALLQFRHLHHDSLSLKHQFQLNSLTTKQSN
jgi:hypothetical protein